jgi:hypothetical protein
MGIGGGWSDWDIVYGYLLTTITLVSIVSSLTYVTEGMIPGHGACLVISPFGRYPRPAPSATYWPFSPGQLPRRGRRCG